MAHHRLILASITLALALAGCVTLPTNRDPNAFIGGQRLDPPPGWVDYCRRHPNDVDCRR